MNNKTQNEEIINRLIGKKIIHPKDSNEILTVMSESKDKKRYAELLLQSINLSQYLLAEVTPCEQKTVISLIKIDDGQKTEMRLLHNDLERVVKFLLLNMGYTEEKALAAPKTPIIQSLHTPENIEQESILSEIQRLKEIEKKYYKLLEELRK